MTPEPALNKKEMKQRMTDYICLVIKNNQGESEMIFDDKGVTKITIKFDR